MDARPDAALLHAKLESFSTAMRLHFHLSPNGQRIPLEYQHYLTGTFHLYFP